MRTRLLAALALLAFAVLTVGAIAWAALTRGTDQLERLHSETLAGVDRALTLSQNAANLATLAPYLLTLDSPFRIAQEGAAATAMVDTILDSLPQDDPLRAALDVTRGAIANLVRDTSFRAGLRDRSLRLNAELAAAERRFAALSSRPAAPLAERQDWLGLQRIAAALLGAGRAENLVGVGEFHRDFVRLTSRPISNRLQQKGDDLARLTAIALGPDGLFELRRTELARQIAAEAALVLIRQGAAAVTSHAADATAKAQTIITAERIRTTTAITVAKSTLLLVVLASAALALAAALYVSGYVTANLRAISDAMIRLAGGDRQTRLPRGTGQGDEIGKLFYAFRAFRANVLRLDRSHRAIAQRTALYEKMMAGISDGMAILSDQGQIVARNGQLATVLRVPDAQLTDRAHLADVIAAAGWQQGENTGGFTDFTLPGEHHVELRKSALPGGGAVVLICDATERRQVEDRLRHIQRIEALGKVSGEVAHDFGNILSTISASLHLMDTAPPMRRAKLQHTIASAVDIGTALTGRLLAFARRQHLEPETVDLPTLIEGMVDLVGFAVSDTIEIVVKRSASPLCARVDPGQFESALLNLCLNSSQAIEGEGRITLSTRREGDQAVIEVTDTGSGMSPDVAAHAMEPFFTARADGTGTGLGLAMVYGFMRQSGGDVHITSTLGQGTTVRLTLPIDKGAAATLPTLGTVLLVDDDTADQAAAYAILSKTAQVLHVAQDGASAMQQVRHPLDLIVTDLSLLGQIEGWRLAGAVLTRWPQAVAIVVSGHLPKINPLAAQFPGRTIALEKPMTEETLASAYSKLISADKSAAKSNLPSP